MPVDIKIIRPREFIRTNIEGEIDLEQSKKMLLDISDIANPPSDYDILIDSRKAKYKLSTVDLYSLAVELCRHKEFFRKHIALLVKKKFFNEAEFLELCSQNRGVRLEAFNSYEDALEWLMSFEKK